MTLYQEPAPILRDSSPTLDARALAGVHAQQARRGGAKLRRDIRVLTRRLERAELDLVTSVTVGRLVTPAMRWLVDNLYLRERIVPELLTAFSAQSERVLPTTGGKPCIVELIELYVSKSDSRVDRETLGVVLQDYQAGRSLELKELALLAPTIKLVLLENLARAAERVALRQRVRGLANEAVDGALTGGQFALDGLERNAATLTTDFLLLPFVAHVEQQLRGAGEHGESILQRLEMLIAARQTTLANVAATVQGEQIATTATISHIIDSLRMVDTIDWQAFFDTHSAVDHVLRANAAFNRLATPTKALYRHAVEMLARDSRRSETDIATAVLVAIRDADDDAQADPGFVLVGDGRPAFEASLGVRWRWRTWLRRSVAHRLTLAYLGPIVLITWFVVIRPLSDERILGTPFWAVAPVALLGLFAASELALALVNRLAVEAVGHQPLPRLDFAEGIPDAFRTVVAVPAFLSSIPQLAELVGNLEVHFLANPDPGLSFVLLADFDDAEAETLAADASLLDHVRTGIDALNARHPAEGRPRFAIVHRRRLWNGAEDRWMGWERKRGKLDEFNRVLRGATGTSIQLIHPAAAFDGPPVRFVIVLDADTRLPPHTARELAAALAHPLNRPQLDPVLRRVVRGHGLLQPRITPLLPEAAAATRLQRLGSMNGGIDPYAFTTSDVYQDLFGEGSFVGKGIYDVDAMSFSLAGRIPPNAVLSHDLLEGLYMRAALISDIELFEHYPSNYVVATRREHRWIRGDWQLLPWIFGRFARGARASAGQPVPLLSWWKLLDNLRRSLTPLATILALFAVWMTGFQQPAAVSAVFVASAIAAPLWMPVFDLVMAVSRRQISGLAARLTWSLRIGAVQTFVSLVMLAHHAWTAADAVGRTLWRVAVSRRNLLQWTTAAQLEARARRTLPSFYADMAMGAGIGLAALAVGVASGGQTASCAVPLGIVWMLAPLLAWWLSRAPPATAHAIDPATRREFTALARDTWAFFAQFVGPEDNFLPPDNIQLDRDPAVAHRTSPTNIGLYLLSIVAARDLGLIDGDEMVRRLEATFDSLGRLEKHHGHLLNWYDTVTTAPLAPRYVSTVDSGNFAAHLLAVKSACRAFAAEQEGAARDKLLAIAESCERLFVGMDFRFLIDPKRRLLAIGFRCDDGVLDPACYDLLASEARLANFVAIAKGDAPREMWFRLGRPLTLVQGRGLMLSWSGSMFEYLMPSLVMRAPAGSLIAETLAEAVRQQIAYGEEHGAPWGVSESAYNERDAAGNYQYRAFGLPALGLKPGLETDFVVAPYATALAALIDPVAAARNFTALAAAGARGKFGFIEAIDFTPQRLPRGVLAIPVETYMSHHQGMSFIAAAAVLRGPAEIDRFHADPRVRAYELLLQERAARGVAATTVVPPARPELSLSLDLAAPAIRELNAATHDTPVVQILSNGRYAVALTAAGGGYSRWRQFALTRWHGDAAVDRDGVHFILHDGKALWSAGDRGPGATPTAYSVAFCDDRADFTRRDGEIATALSVVVAAEDDVELRTLTLTNIGDEPRTIVVNACAELALAPQADDAAHPAFSRMFVTTERDAATEGLIAERRPRASEDPTAWSGFVMTVEGAAGTPVEFDTSRESFVGRGRSLMNPAGATSTRLAGHVGTVLDPMFALRTAITLPGAGTVKLRVALIAAATRDDVLRLLQRYRQPAMFERAATQAWTRARINLHYLGIGPLEAEQFQALAVRVLFPTTRPIAARKSLHAAPASALWPLGISGDLPVVIAHARDEQDLDAVRQLARCRAYWQTLLVDADFVVIDETPTSYQRGLWERLQMAIRQAPDIAGRAEAGLRGQFVVVRGDALGPETLRALTASAVANFPAGGDGLAEATRPPRRVEAPRAEPPPRRARAAPQRQVLEFDNGFGGFGEEGRAYVIAGVQPTPMPWANVVANPSFGFIATSSGGGYSWSQNSRERKLTPWSNDPIEDPPGDIIYLHDGATGESWSIARLPAPVADGAYRVTHGLGFTTFACDRPGLEARLTLSVPRADPVRVGRLRLTNTGPRARRIGITSYVEWVLGAQRMSTAPHVVSVFDRELRCVIARNPRDPIHAARLAFVHLAQSESAIVDRTRFIGPGRDLANPLAPSLVEWPVPTSDGRHDPCAALRRHLVVPAGETIEIVILLGDAEDRAHIASLIARFAPVEAAAIAERDARSFWTELTGRIAVRTPDRAFDVLVNHWLPYQTLSCRIWGRTGFYQAGGAYGFRDQLQDVMAVVLLEPAIAREHLLRAAGRQFEAGDVQHWWHPPAGAGTRTRIADDPIWLAAATARYIEITGDDSVLDEEAGFLTGPALAPGQADAYFEPALATRRADLFEHCVLALECSLGTGRHGLPLIGSGDWNDGMNRVGIEGRGESVWLGWFLIDTLRRFAGIARKRGKISQATAWLWHADTLGAAIEAHAWDGAWYRRAFFDDGTPLGTHTADECRIDSIAQSWAVISGMRDAERCRQAMDAVETQLVAWDEMTCRLLTPPFAHSKPSPGYIAAYPSGIRENGGQYTHAAAWAVMGFAGLGDGARAFKLFSLINPINHARTADAAKQYRLEPFAVAGDVYSGTEHPGRGGWSWYTGSSGWLYRAAIESILGVRIEAGALRLDPCLPPDWDNCEITLSLPSGKARVMITNPDHVARGIAELTVDGHHRDPDVEIALSHDCAIEIHVRLGARS